jgi:hypothetical protein
MQTTLLDPQKIPTREKLILTGLFLSKYDASGLKKLGFESFAERQKGQSSERGNSRFSLFYLVQPLQRRFHLFHPPSGFSGQSPRAPAHVPAVPHP